MDNIDGFDIVEKQTKFVSEIESKVKSIYNKNESDIKEQIEDIVNSDLYNNALTQTKILKNNYNNFTNISVSDGKEMEYCDEDLDLFLSGVRCCLEHFCSLIIDLQKMPTKKREKNLLMTSKA